jgi:SAM-dependent methyltransferase
MSDSPSPSHAPLPQSPSEWVRRFAPCIEPGGDVLDVAAGSGRHARLLASLGHRVEAVDRDASALSSLDDLPGVVTRIADLENAAWPYSGRSFAAVVVTNYLHRPLLPLLIEAVASNGILLYETFAVGNEQFGRPSNPEFLLRPEELLEAVRGRLRVIAFEDVHIEQPKPAMVQHICARRT